MSPIDVTLHVKLLICKLFCRTHMFRSTLEINMFCIMMVIQSKALVRCYCGMIAQA